MIALDCETTISNKGNPYDSTNKMVTWSFATEHSSGSHEVDVPGIQQLVDAYGELVVGANFKFDKHWFEKIGVVFQEGARYWDVLIAEFVLDYQRNKFPSLNQAAERFGLKPKLDVVKTEYWEKGIDTDKIPLEILHEYGKYDAELTLKVYQHQQQVMTPKQKRLVNLMGLDLVILCEMERNGLFFNEELCDQRAKEIDEQIDKLNSDLRAIYPTVPINFNSNDHLSAFLYGGVVTEESKEHVGFYKSGAKAGQPKYKNITVEHTLPRLYTPLKGSEMQKEGVYSTNAQTLQKLSGKKGLITKILELAKLDKLNGTYYRGLPKLRKEMNWEHSVLHGNFNQTIAATGRLSSSKPNLQNFASDLQDIFISRYTT